MDGVSPIYLPQDGSQLFKEMTGGQLASWHILSAFGHSHGPELSLRQFLISANNALGKETEQNDLNIKESAHIPSACFLVIKIEDRSIQIIQGGDCMAAWQYKDGSRGGISHQNFGYEEFLVLEIKRLMKKHNQDRQAMWEEFRPILEDRRQRFINNHNGICLLNGQPHFREYWREETIELENLKTLLLFSDGFIPFEWSKESEDLALNVFNLWNMLNQNCLFPADKLARILLQTRATAEKAETHEDNPEATVISIEF